MKNMASLHCFSLYSKAHTFSLPNISPTLGLPYVSTKTSSFSPCILHATDTDSQKYEVDPDQAKEALKELDQQIQYLSNKQVTTPKIKASDIKLTRDETTSSSTEEAAVAQGLDSFLLNWTIALFLFTIFYNVLFITVIKPAIDGPESPPSPVATATSSAGKASQGIAVLQSLPMLPEIKILPR